MSKKESAPDVDTDFATAGIARYREVAKWTVGVVGGVAVVLAAGLQLTDLRELTGWMLGVACVSVIGLVGSAIFIVKRALTVMEPIEVRLSAVEPSVIAELTESGLMPFEATTGEEVSQRFSQILGSSGLSDAEKKKWRARAQELVDEVALYSMRRRFRGATRDIFKAAGIGVFFLVVFAYVSQGADDSDDPSPVVPPTPTAVKVTLTDEGKSSLGEVLGKQCVSGPFAGIAIGGDEKEPVLVSVPTANCKVARFSLPLTLGIAQSSESAPTSDSSG